MYSEVLLTVCRESVHSWNIILTSTMQWLITECPLQCSSRRSVSSSSHCFLLCSLHEQYELCFVSNYSTVIDRIVWRIQIFTTVLALPIGCWSRCLRWLAVCLYFCTVSVGYCEFNCQHQCNWLREERQFWLCRPPLVFLVSVWVHSFCSWFMEHFLDVQNWSNNITCITVTDYAGIVSFGCVLLHLTTKLQFLVFCKSSSFVVVVVCWFGLCSNFYVSTLYLSNRLPSVLWHCWLGSRNSICPVKNWVVGCCRGYLQGADLHITQLMPRHSLSLASVKSRLVLPFWYRLTRTVLNKGPLNGCVCVCTYPIDGSGDLEPNLQNILRFIERLS